jgi:peptide deformylase
VTIFDAELDRLIDDMVETMYAAPGIGLAAPQIGVPKRLCVIDLHGGKNPADLLILINPEFVQRDGMQLEDEGCLSVPGFTATVPRPAKAVVKALDSNGTDADHRSQWPAGAGVSA